MKHKLGVISDKIRITGPKVDGGFSVILDVGEHGQLDVAKLLAIPQNSTIKWSIEEVKDGNKKAAKKEAAAKDEFED